MNGLRASTSEAERLLAYLKGGDALTCDVMICPPATLLSLLRDLFGEEGVLLGGQDCHTEASGAMTGDVSAEMLADAGCTAVIVGHSERRADHGETDALVCAKARAAHRAGLVSIICIGETEAERDRGATLNVLARQLDGSAPDGSTAENTIVAYEPVWAIGTGRTPGAEEIGEVHAFIRSRLTARFGTDGANMRLLYGGSVKPANAAELMAIDNVNGALVGGASLKANDLWGILSTYEGET